jgi:hypothetical protein
MNGLFRTYIETQPRWSVVGPDHQRLYFNHLDLVGYAPAAPNGFSVYAMNGVKTALVYKTVPLAKRAALAWMKGLLPRLAQEQIIWTPIDTGVHWEATVNGFKIANYYKCDKPTGHWHVDFRVWFAGTFYTRKFTDHSDAQSAVAETWQEWLELAGKHLSAPVRSIPSNWNPRLPL